MSQLDTLLKNVEGLEERFLKSDEKLDELPYPEMPDEDGGSEAEGLLDTVMHSVSSLNSLVKVLKRPSYVTKLGDMLSQEQINQLDELQSALDAVLDSLGAEAEAEEEQEEEPEDSEEEEETEEEPEEDEPEDKGDEEESEDEEEEEEE